MELRFPYSPRPWQPQAIEDLATFVDSPTKHAVLVASCGEGKESVMAMTVLKWVLGGGKAVWLTAKGATGEWNKRKELEACLSVNPIPVTVAFLRAKEDACPYRHEWAKERGAKPPPAVEFCAVARPKCRYYKGLNATGQHGSEHDTTWFDPTSFDSTTPDMTTCHTTGRASIEQNTIGPDKIGRLDRQYATRLETRPNATLPNATLPHFTNLTTFNFIDEKSVPKDVCPYYYLREAIKRAGVIIADYNYVIHPIIRTMILKAYPNFLDEKTLLLFDEAHLLAERARGTIRGRLSTRTINKAIDEVRGKFLIKRRPDLVKAYRVDKSAIKVLQHIGSKIRHVVQRKSMEIKREFEVTEEEKAKIQYYDYMDKQIEESIELLKRIGERIAKFKFENGIGVISWTTRVAGFLKRFMDLKERGWLLSTCGLMRTRGGKKKHPYVGFMLLDPWVSVAKALRLCGKAIFYSGTLHDENFATVFRLREYEPLKGYPPSFPPENRLDVFVSDGKIVRDYYETDEGAQRICEGIVRWYNKVGHGRCYTVMTSRLYQRLSPLLKERGLKARMMPLNVPKSLRKREIEASFADPTISVSLSPYSWAGSSCDIQDCISVLTIGIPVARLTLERRETIEYFRRLLREEKPERAAWVRIAIIPALENAVQASERARRFSEQDRICHVWMDERYVRKRGYHGHIKTLTGAKNIKFAHSLDEMGSVLEEWNRT